MAVYLPTEIQQAGIPSKQAFTAGTSYTIIITPKQSPVVGAAYLTIASPGDGQVYPSYFEGSTFVPTNIVGTVNDVAGNHWACVVPFDGGVSSIIWTPAVNIPLGAVYVKGTGGIGCDIL